MTPVLLVAQREYRQLTSTRSFWLTLFAIPVILVFVALIPTLYRHEPGPSAYVLLDRTGRYTGEIEHMLELDHQKLILSRLADYADRWQIRSPTLRPSHLIDDMDAEQFLDSHGLEKVLAEIDRQRPREAPPFSVPPPRFIEAKLPAGVPNDSSAQDFGGAVRGLMDSGMETSAGLLPLGTAVYIPPDPKDRATPIQAWTNGRAGPDLANIVSGVVLHSLRIDMMREGGLDPDLGRRIELFYPTMSIHLPAPGTGANRVAVRSALPLALAYLLLITIIVSGTMMLQGVIEERSNKLLETLLACISAETLMRGKLIGVGAVGLTIVATWLAFAIGAATMIPGDIADALRPALATLHAPLPAFSLVFYFLTGYLVTSMLFLSIGALSDSMQDAQGYLMPLVLILSGPFVALVGTVVTDPDGLMPVILSWIPLYTPFAMLARLGSGVPLRELVGTTALLMLFLTAEFTLLGRVFRAGLLRSGQPPKLTGVLRLMFAKDPG